MTSFVTWASQAAVIGAGATAALDLWSLYVARAFGVKGLDYGLLGRWIGGLLTGKGWRQGLSTAASVGAERVTGWVAHYAIGVLFAAGLLVRCGPEWASDPTPGPALALGLATVVFPFFVLQPAMGAGVAAAKSPDPLVARLRSLGSHAVFGLGLYLTASLLPVIRS